MIIDLILPFSSACVMRYVYNRLWHPKPVGDGGWTNAPCTAVEIFASPKPPHVTVIQMMRKIRGCLEVHNRVISVFTFQSILFHQCTFFHATKQNLNQQKNQNRQKFSPNYFKWTHPDSVVIESMLLDDDVAQLNQTADKLYFYFAVIQWYFVLCPTPLTFNERNLHRS